jgi:hypothetical protein
MQSGWRRAAGCGAGEGTGSSNHPGGCVVVLEEPALAGAIAMRLVSTLVGLGSCGRLLGPSHVLGSDVGQGCTSDI